MKEIQVPENCGSFLVRGIQQFDAMMTDICLHKKKNTERQSEIECCFHIAKHYEQILLSELSHYEFGSQVDEIFFFKRIKPLFSGEIEYYGLCNYAEIFKHSFNENGEKRFAGFYEKEQLRLEKFGKENPDFYNYVLEDGSDMDEVWFTRLEDDKTKSAYDGLMGTYMAIEKYVAKVGGELKILEKSKGSGK